MFVHELKMYIDYLKNKISETGQPVNARGAAQLKTFKNNLLSGIEYYSQLFSNLKDKFHFSIDQTLHHLETYKAEVQKIEL